MSNCCDIESTKHQKRRVLIIVLVINTLMFITQVSAALIAHSTALLADSLDMLGDALTYGISLYAVEQGGEWIAKASKFKAYIILTLSVIVIFEAAVKLFYFEVFPSVSMMAIFSLLGLVANGICLYLLTQHRHHDVNMRSTWICARNDIIGNTAVLLTAGFVAFSNSHWPDIIVGLCFAVLLIYSAIQILREANSV